MKLNYHYGAIISGWLLTAMILVGELYTPFKDFLKGVFSHHWIGKAIITFIVFLAVAYVFQNTKKVLNRPVEEFSYQTMTYSLFIVGLFYVLHFVWGE